VVTIKQEAGGWKYAIGAFAYMTTFAYVAAMVVYQVASRFGY
jgi:Fe2+ transport system protein B